MTDDFINYDVLIRQYTIKVMRETIRRMRLKERGEAMTFTDDDLKLLKAANKEGPTVHIGPERLQALLARLEAAEAVIELACCGHDNQEHEDEPCSYSAAYLEWRKAGK